MVKRSSGVLIRSVNTRVINKIWRRYSWSFPTISFPSDVCLFFFLQHNAINTGNNGETANLPKAKLDFARLSFYFWGASIFYSLPLGLRNKFWSFHLGKPWTIITCNFHAVLIVFNLVYFCFNIFYLIYIYIWLHWWGPEGRNSTVCS